MSTRQKYNKLEYNFKKGDKIHLDSIYPIQGIAGGTWWDHVESEISDDCIITKNIEIIIKWR